MYGSAPLLFAPPKLATLYGDPTRTPSPLRANIESPSIVTNFIHHGQLYEIAESILDWYFYYIINNPNGMTIIEFFSPTGLKIPITIFLIAAAAAMFILPFTIYFFQSIPAWVEFVQYIFL
jgi:hypothetical protein